ncbi:cysteine proteinase [Aaosphaeria arxii CBS 175.79]|uniref:Ubiquitin carboxyl-terminal hydrolase n=1 Tax=Aaosphaeria arxii CBS 175.79 TaxID=1450172 RepID=A0A6A5XKA6_9PLEO|nr:cysteine proteinase [Aaosphaeria arxii CBS 175.79]KAF2013306.1 cysteine proteinase [Aaosphaeria arxii CBS 175.79]
MTSFFGRFKGNAGPASPASSAPPVKKDPNAPQPTPLEKLLTDAGPLRADGSDKFFGYENFGSTCYCNSIVQCLYYSVPFREQVINFPSRSPPEALERPANAPLPRLDTDIAPATNGQNSALSPKGRNSMSAPSAPAGRKPSLTPVNPMGGPPPTKPEDNKDSPEYKKKAAMAAGPILDMNYENSSAYGMPESLFTSLKDIFEAVIAHRSRIGVVSPNKFLEILRRDNEMFRTPMHQDAHEFLNLLLNEVVDNVEKFSKAEQSRITEVDGTEANGTTVTNGVTHPDKTSAGALSNIGWVHDLFEGTLTSETRCLTCEKTSQRDEVFLDLSVDLDQHSSVTSCLRKFSEEEMLCERNKFHCDNCGGLQEAEKRMKIKRLPRILALHLKRFKYTEDLQRLQKLFHRVVYPYYLRLFNTTDDAEDPDRLYELYAVVVHIGGGPYHGHYVSIIKTQDRGWLLFDDEMVEPVDKAYVRNFFGGENVLACAYVLFYQETTFEAMQKEQEAENLAAAKQATEAEQEAVPVAAPKANGTANGHPLQHATTPTPEVDEQLPKLNHAATAPPLPTTPHYPLESVPTSIPQLNNRKSAAAMKKEKAKEEKERKAAEKELEKQQKLKRKELETQRRENYKRQEDELKQALAASKSTAKADEEKRRREGGSDEGDKEDKEALKEKENGSFGKTSLSRFRHSSMSIRHKPKFWSGNHKHEDSEHETPSTPGTDVDEKPEKSKNRFSIGRKKSTFHL